MKREGSITTHGKTCFSYCASGFNRNWGATILNKESQFPLVSIIVSVYNTERYLERCLDTLLAQTYHNIEIVLIDDGSNDDSRLICDRYASQDQRIRIYHRDNKGLPASRNFGLEKCNGEFFMFADPDDLVSEQYVERLLCAIKQSNCHVAMCKSKNIFDTEIEDYYCITEDGVTVIPLADIDYTLPYRCDLRTTWVVWGAIYDKVFLGDIRFATDLKISSDLVFFAEVLKRCGEVALIQDKLYGYIRYESSLSAGCYNWNRYSNVLAWERTVACFSDIPTVRQTAEAMEVLASCDWVRNLVRNGVNDKKLYLATLPHFRGRWRRVKDVPLPKERKRKLFLLTLFPSGYLFLYQIALSLRLLRL